MTHMRAVTRHRYILQVSFVAIGVAASVLVTDALAFRSLANLTWMIGLPIGAGMVANVGCDRRCMMAMMLLGVSVIVLVVVGVHFTSYG